MKLEYLAEGSADCPLLRLYDFTSDEAKQLLIAVTGLATGSLERVDVERLPFVEPVEDCRLCLVRSPWDRAVVRIGPSAFECGFTSARWDNVAGLIEPFAEEGSVGGFQWLATSPGEVAFLLSPSGKW
jgi:hypothetical protein